MTSGNQALLADSRLARSQSRTLSFALILAVLVALLTAFSGCTKEVVTQPPGTGGGTGGNGGNKGNVPPNEKARNVLKIGINAPGFCNGDSYTNKPCVKVTVCSPDGNQCTEVTDILLDTGSFGLRLFKQAVPGINFGGSPMGNLAECMEYGDGSKQWGPVKTAMIKLGNEPAVSTSIQIIDASFPGMGTACSGAEASPSDAGFNGILGVGMFDADCGPYCANTETNNVYFTCAGATCTPVKVPQINQVRNPVALLPEDNSGVMVQLPKIPDGGKLYEYGWLVFGIGTSDNNKITTETRILADPDKGEMSTTYDGNSLKSFIDSGSNAYGLPSGSSMNCGGQYDGWLCPQVPTYAPKRLSATMYGYNGGPGTSVDFWIGNFQTLYESGMKAFHETAYQSNSNISGYFDWGLPFYYGRSVFVGLEGHGGTYWAF